MLAPQDCALVLLAAGRSLRFGDADKLREPFLGQPLAFHVVTALADIPFKARFAVVSATDLDFAGRGYSVVYNPVPGEGMASSLKLGVAAARDIGCAGVVVALADMPRVTASHIYRLLEAATGLDAVVASSNGIHPTPPAVFGAGRFDSLLTLDGDAGARTLIRAGRHVIAPDAELLDVDRPEDLERLRALT